MAGTIMGIIITIIIAIIIVRVIVVKVRNMKKEKLAWQKKWEEKREKKNRIKNNAVVNSWCNEIVSSMLPIIKKEPHKDCSIEIKSEKQRFVIGYNLQLYYLTHTGKYISNNGTPNVLRAYNFAEHGLPELSFSDRELFSETFAEMVKDEFRKLGHKCTTIRYPIALKDTSEEYSLYVIRYDRVVNNNTW